MGPLELNLAGTAYRLDFAGFHRPLGVATDTLAVTLQPWTYRRHMDTLRLCTAPSAAGLRLDSRVLCDAVLAGVDAAEAARHELAPIALWWAAGGDAPLAQPPAEGEWLDLGSYDNPARVRLHPWTEHQRLTALDASLSEEHDDSWFDPVRYLESMVDASVATLDAPTGLDDLDARATALLLHATVALNVIDEEADHLLQGGEAARQCAARTLRLCQELGWTPTKVWATPAAEVDRLLRMLDLLQPAARTPRRRSLADHPDATVIRIDDDGDDEAVERMSW